MLNHYRGNKANYKGDVGEAHRDGIYFATDTGEILMNGQAYGGSTDASTHTTADITISGGPLATEFGNEEIPAEFPNSWKKYGDDGKTVIGYKIPANSSLQEILQNLFCVEKWGSLPEASAGSISVTIGSPSISNHPSGLVEVGQKVTIGAMQTGAISYQTTDAKFNKNFEYGYADSNKNIISRTSSKPDSVSIQSATIAVPNVAYEALYVDVSQVNAVTLDDATNYQVTQKDGKQDRIVPKTMPTMSKTAINGSCSFSFTAKEGTNSISYGMVTNKDNNINASGTSPAIDSYYPLSSLGNVGTTATEAVSSKPVSDQSANVTRTNSFSFKGVYPIFTNGITLTSEATNEDGAYCDGGASGKRKLDLIDETTTMYLGFGSADVGPSGRKWCLYLPAGWSIDFSQGFRPGDPKIWTMHAAWVQSTQTETIQVQGVNVAYNKYTCIGSAGSANAIKITLKKS